MSFNNNITAISDAHSVAEDLLLKFPDIYGSVIVQSRTKFYITKVLHPLEILKQTKMRNIWIASVTKNFTNAAVLKLLFFIRESSYLARGNA